MKKILLLCSLALTGIIGATVVSCGGDTPNPTPENPGGNNGGNNNNNNNDDTFDTSKNISLYSRESGSGTRECFFEGIGYGDVKKDDKWNKGVTVSAQSSNGAIMSAVGSDQYALGYCSLDSLDTVSTIKGLKFNGVEASNETVVDGTYGLQRNFNYVVRDSDLYTDAKKAKAKEAFEVFMTESSEGLQAIASQGGILTKNVITAKKWSEIAAEKFPGLDIDGVELRACGSTSVEKVLGGLAASFEELTGCKVSPNQSGSGDAVKGVTASGEGAEIYGDIGFLSREINAEEMASLNTNNKNGAICKDAVVPIVNVKNTAVENVTADILAKAYKGEVKTWSAFIEAIK